MISTSKIRASAREALAGKWGKGVVIALAYLLFSFIMGVIIGIFEEGSAIASIVEIAQLIIEVPVSFGLVFAFIKLKRGEDVDAFEFLTLGFSIFSKSWKIQLSVLVKMLLPIVLIVISLLLTVGATVSTLVASETAILLSLLATVLFLITFAYAFAKGLLYSLVYFIAYDNPEMLASEVVNKSAELMNGNRGNLVTLELSFLGWMILAIFTFGIGYLWLVPYMQVALVCFYEKVLESKDESII